MVEGFTAPDESGSQVRLHLTNSPGKNIDTFKYLNSLPLSKPQLPSELALLKKAVASELEKLSAADKVLKSLTTAIEKFSSLLEATTRNENSLQKCLTNNPILFGLEYKSLVPKPSLGSEYEMDYGLEKISGLIDIVEIEASTYKLFTQGSNPTKDLIHAEDVVGRSVSE